MAVCLTAYLGGSYTQSSSARREMQLEHALARSQRCFLLLQGRHETVDRARVAFFGASEALVSFAVTVITTTENFRDSAVEEKRRQGSIGDSA
jgi:hypothetical protein